MNHDGDGTRVDVVTDLSITGKVAQFGRGVLDDVSAKLLRQFVDNLERDVLSGGTDTGAPVTGAPGTETVASPPAPGSQADTSIASANGSAAGGTSTNGSESSAGPRRIEHREVEPIDLLDVAGESAARRLVPVGIGVLVLIVLWRLLRGRS